MIEQIVRHVFNQEVISFRNVDGGCINNAYYVQLEDQELFIKKNSKDFEAIFQKESKGLDLLSSRNLIKVPKILATGATNGCSFLILEWIEKGTIEKKSFNQLGKDLASLHSNLFNDKFGLDHNNWIGSLEQRNNFFSSWDEFMIVNRYEYLLKIAIEKGLISIDELKFFEKIYREFQNLIPKEKPSLIHGDLWNGNVIYDQTGSPLLIDPAVHFGHREMDIAMTKLFGGFDDEFYRSYNESFPLEKGWENRIKVNQLYPLLVHLVLFGRTYWNDIKMTVSKYI